MFIAESEISKKIRGKILAEVTDIEKYLTKFLSDYFTKDREKREELYDLIFNTELLSLRKKINMFKKILPKLDYKIDNKDRTERLIQSFIFINEIRNKVAHWNWSMKKSQNRTSYLQNPRKKEEYLRLDSKLLKRYDNSIGEILMFFDALES